MSIASSRGRARGSKPASARTAACSAWVRWPRFSWPPSRSVTSTTRNAPTRSATARSSAISSRTASTSRRASSSACSSRSRTETRRSTVRSRQLPPLTADLWDTIADDAGRESELWTAALRPREDQERQPVFSTLGEEHYSLGIETIYEGYLLHYGASRLFAPEDGDTALLLGDYLYAHGLVRIEQAGSVDAVNEIGRA